jgi:hypothetical protein
MGNLVDGVVRSMVAVVGIVVVVQAWVGTSFEVEVDSGEVAVRWQIWVKMTILAVK